MRNIQIVIAAVLMFMLGIAIAEEQAKSTPDIDEVIALCEGKYNSEEYNDENELTRLYDECVDSMVNQAQAAPKSDAT